MLEGLNNWMQYESKMEFMRLDKRFPRYNPVDRERFGGRREDVMTEQAVASALKCRRRRRNI